MVPVVVPVLVVSVVVVVVPWLLQSLAPPECGTSVVPVVVTVLVDPLDAEPVFDEDDDDEPVVPVVVVPVVVFDVEPVFAVDGVLD